MKTNKIFIVLCLALASVLMFGCGRGADKPAADNSPAVEDDNGNGNGNVNGGEADADKELLSFNPSVFYFGKKYSEIEAEFADLEYRGSMSGGEYYYSPSTETFFIFDVNDIDDPEHPNKDAEVTANTMPAWVIFPNMGSQVDKAVIEKIVGTDLDSAMDDFGAPNIYFSYKGHIFWYGSEGTPDLLSGTLVTVKEDS